MNIYEFKANDYLGNEVSLEQFKGQVVLIVNTATRCGFTPQYDGLEKLYEDYKDQGFVILDFPCNQFLAQAPGTAAEINDVCVLKFGTKFPRFDKVKVNGKDAHPLFTYLEKQNPSGKVQKVKWNFTKFLIGRDGTFLERFEPTAKPEEMEAAIKEALGK